MVLSIAASVMLSFSALRGPSLLLWATSPNPQRLSKDDETSMAAARAVEAKIQALSSPAPEPLTKLQPIVITDLEANSYLKHFGWEFLPRGVYSPEVHIQPGFASGIAEVDFSELNDSRPKTEDWSAKILATFFRGRQRVSAKVKVTTGNGEGKLTIEEATFGSMSIPDWLVSLMVETYVEMRYEVDLSKPMPLPGHVTHVELTPGRAIFYRNSSQGR